MAFLTRVRGFLKTTCAALLLPMLLAQYVVVLPVAQAAVPPLANIQPYVTSRSDGAFTIGFRDKSTGQVFSPSNNYYFFLTFASSSTSTSPSTTGSYPYWVNNGTWTVRSANALPYTTMNLPDSQTDSGWNPSGGNSYKMYWHVRDRNNPTNNYWETGSFLTIPTVTSWCNSNPTAPGCGGGGGGGGGGSGGTTSCQYSMSINGTTISSPYSGQPTPATVNVVAGSPIVMTLPAPYQVTVPVQGGLTSYTMNVSGGLSGSFSNTQTYTEGRTYTLPSISNSTNISITYSSGSNVCYSFPVTLNAIQQNPDLTAVALRDTFLGAANSRVQAGWTGLRGGGTLEGDASTMPSAVLKITPTFTNGDTCDFMRFDPVTNTTSTVYSNRACTSGQELGGDYTFGSMGVPEGPLTIRTQVKRSSNPTIIDTLDTQINYDRTRPQVQITNIPVGYAAGPVSGLIATCTDLDSTGATTNASGCYNDGDMQYASVGSAGNCYQHATLGTYMNATKNPDGTWTIPQTYSNTTYLCVRGYDRAGNIGVSQHTVAIDTGTPSISVAGAYLNGFSMPMYNGEYFLTGDPASWSSIAIIAEYLDDASGINLIESGVTSPQVVSLENATNPWGGEPNVFLTEVSPTLLTAPQTSISLRARDNTGKETNASITLVREQSAPTTTTTSLALTADYSTANPGLIVPFPAYTDSESGVVRYELQITRNGTPLAIGGAGNPTILFTPAGATIGGMNAQGWMPITGAPLPTTGVIDGLIAKDANGDPYTYVVSVRAVNAANLTSTPVTGTMQFETNNPILTITALQAVTGQLYETPGVVWVSQNIVLDASYTMTDTESGLSLCQVVMEDAGDSENIPVLASLCPVFGSTATVRVPLTSGMDWYSNKSLNLLAIDRLANRSTLTRSFQFDRMAPTVTLNGGATWNADPVTVTMACTDGESGCDATSYTYCTTAGCTPSMAFPAGGLDVDTTTTLRVQARDRVGNPSTITERLIQVDSIDPTWELVSLEHLGESILPHTDGKYYLPADINVAGSNTFTIISRTVETGSGVANNQCTITGLPQGTIPCEAGATLEQSLTLPAETAEREYVVTVTVTDNVARSNSYTLTLVRDTTDPEIVLPGTIVPTEANRTLSVTLPHVIDANLHQYVIDVATQLGDTMLTAENITTTDPRVQIVDGNIVITRDAIGFPATIDIVGLLANQGETQLIYTVTVTAVDLAGNTVEQTLPAIRFDTIAPSIDSVTALATSGIRGNGSQATPFLVNADRALPLELDVRETSNSTSGARSLPLRLSVDSPDVTLAGNPQTICSTNTAFDAISNQCTTSANVTVNANMNGMFTLTLRDGGGNTTTRDVYVQQDSSTPILGPDFAITAYAQTGTPANLPEGATFKDNRYVFTVEGITDTNTGGALYAEMTYPVNAGTQTVIVPLTQEGTGYTMIAQLPGLALGDQNLSIVFLDAFGNSHVDASNGNSTDPIGYDVAFDNVAPDVQGFTYTWVDDQLTVAWSNIVDASFPIRVTATYSTDGTTWESLPNGVLVLANSADADAQMILEVPVPNAQVRLQVRDTVYALDETGRLIADGSTLREYAIAKEINIVVTEVPAEELLRVTYEPVPARVGSFAGLTVTATDPYGKTTPFTLSAFDNAGGELGTIARPVVGTYSFAADLTYNDGTAPFASTRSFVLETDMVAPQATFDLLLVPDQVWFDDTVDAYVVNTRDATVPIRYQLQNQYTYLDTTILDDRLPIVVSAEEGAARVSTSVASGGALTGSLTFPTPDQRYYTVTLRAEDAGAADGARFVQRTMRILKKYSGPTTQSTVFDADMEPITTRSIAAGEADVILTNESTATLSVLVTGEPEAPTFDVRQNGTELTGIAIPVLVCDPFPEAPEGGAVVGGVPCDIDPTQFRYNYALTLPSDGLTVIDVRTFDRAGNETIQQVRIRRDTQGPVIPAGTTLVFPERSNTTTLPLLVQDGAGTTPLAVTEYTNVRYEVLSPDGDVITPLTPYTGSIALPIGEQTFVVELVDAFGQRTRIPGTYTVTIDTEAPQLTLSYSIPADQTRTREDSMDIRIVSLTDLSPVTVRVMQNDRQIALETLTPTITDQLLVTVTFDQNQRNDLQIFAEDALGQPAPVQTRSIVHDTQAPLVRAGLLTAQDAAGLTWQVELEDREGTPVQVTSVRMSNLTTGQSADVTTFAQTTSAAGIVTYTVTGAVLPVREGHQYTMTINAQDILGNAADAVTSASYAHPVTTIGQEDSLWTPQDVLELDPSIVGTSIDVRITNGTNIDYLAEDLPRGTHVVIGEVLANGTNRGTPPGELERLPVGIYTITVTDNLGNVQTIPNYVVSPYYYDLSLDLNGDGYEGGLSDLKVLREGELAGVYSVDASTESRKGELLSLFDARIVMGTILEFLRN